MKRLDTFEAMISGLALSALLVTPFGAAQESGMPSSQSGLVSPVSGIGAGDLLDIQILGVPELTQHVRVENNGAIVLPLLGEVPVAGKTGPEAERFLAERLVAAELLVNPQVTIFVQTPVTRRIKVIGEVARPGLYPLLSRFTVLDALAEAGGPSLKASHSARILHDDGTEQSVPLESPEANQIVLRTGDTVRVNRAPVVYAIGEVIRPGGFILDEHRQGSSVLETLALAGGPTRLAKLSDALILRRTEGGIVKRPVPMNHLVGGTLSDLPIEDGDILYVPLSHARESLNRAIEAAFAAGTGFLIYRQ